MRGALVLVLATIGAAAGACAGAVREPGPRDAERAFQHLVLWYSRPAEDWNAALPVGNGRLGAMAFGGVDVVRIQLNEESMWAGPPVPENPENMRPTLAEARRLMFAGRPVEAERLVAKRIMAPRISPRSHQTLGDLRLRMIYPGHAPAAPLAIDQWRRGPVLEQPDERQLAEDFDDGAWTSVRGRDGLAVPPHATVVFRAAFTLREAQIAGGLRQLALSPIDDAAVVCLNGERVGQTRQWNRAYRFDVAEKLRVGRNVLAIAVTNIGGPGYLARETWLTARTTPAHYRRALDLDRAVALTEYEIDGVRFLREVFASPADDVLVVRIAADRPGAVSCDMTLDRPADFATQAAGAARLVMRGRVSHDGKHPGVRYAAVLEAQPEGGNVTADGATLRVRRADALTLLLAARTDYNFAHPAQPRSTDPVAACDAVLRSAKTRRYEQLRARNLAEHRRLFRRVGLELGAPPQPEGPTDRRLAAVRDGACDPNLEALLFQYGRYLLICSSRPGTMPANLQGLWNEHLAAPWNADYHLNINVQMNYWPAEVTNLSDCHLPLFDLMEGLVPDGRELARRFGCGGVALGHVTDAWLWTAVQGRPVWGMWPMGAGWLSAHMMEHYRFTQDREFLRRRAYPFLREAAAFDLDWLVEDPKTGLYVSGPTTSPENSYVFEGQHLSLSMGPSMDQEIIRETFENTLEAARILGISDDLTERIRAALPRLASPRIGEDGRLMEWAQPYQEAEPGHRHMSHLYALHPGGQIGPLTTPKLAAAARKSLDYRLAHGGGHTGWSRAWLVNLGARLLDGDFAHEHLRLLLARSMQSNLFDTHPPFQIDGNFGATAGIAEMLLQSHAGQVHLLPALPEAWPTGRVWGLCARGGLVVDIAWRDGQLSRATLRPRTGVAPGAVRIRYRDHVITRDMAPGGTISLTPADFAGTP